MSTPHTQREAPETREARLLDGHRLLTDAVARLSSPADWRAVLDVARRLPAYSPANCLLLAVQDVDGLVMGYHAWRQVRSVDGGYCQVSRGAKGLSILAPATIPVREPGPDGHEHTTRRLVAYRRTTVFDQRALVAPPDLPDARPGLPHDEADQLWHAAAAQLAAAGYTLVADGPAAAAIAPAYGKTDFAARTVTVGPGLPPALRVKTLVHELAHTWLHDPAGLADPPPTPAAVEVEAESVAYLLLADTGLAATDYALPDPASWSRGGTGTVLVATRRTVEAARGLLDAFGRQLGTPSPAVLAVQPVLDADGETAIDPAAWAPPPPPVPICGPGGPHTGVALYSMPNPLTPHTSISTPTGGWELRWDPALASFTAEHTPDPDPGPGLDGGHGQEPIRLGFSPNAIPDLGRLEERLGFPVPAAARDQLTDDQICRPSWSSRPWQLPDGDPAVPPPHTRPGPGSRIRGTGLPEVTYQHAMATGPPLRTWTGQDHPYRLDILAAVRAPDPDTGDLRQQISYRLSHDGTVIFSGDDLNAPGHVDPRADDTVSAVVDLLCYADPDRPLTPTQREFLTRHTDQLLGEVLAPDPPYPPDTRIAVTGPAADAMGRTGAVVDQITRPNGEVLAYTWRPDRADLPGHPWHDAPEHTLVTAADQVTATLASPDRGLTGWTPDTPLNYRATVNYPSPDGHTAAGHVLRAFPEPNGQLTYDIQPDTAAAAPLRIPARQLEPTAGTAYPTLADLTTARAADGVALQPGEVLAVGGHRTRVIDGPDGPTTAPAPPPSPATQLAIPTGVPARGPAPDVGL